MMKRVDKQVFGYCQRVTKPRVRVPQQESSEKSFKEFFFSTRKKISNFSCHHYNDCDEKYNVTVVIDIVIDIKYLYYDFM